MSLPFESVADAPVGQIKRESVTIATDNQCLDFVVVFIKVFHCLYDGCGDGDLSTAKDQKQISIACDPPHAKNSPCSFRPFALNMNCSDEIIGATASTG